ncbi:type-1 fimbrial protein subunit A [Pseudomonas aeruginosa]|uniref:fimbrial protein n=1 Tax=Pseudomonas aeruginosa TaxID=287 RepID=UPI0009A843F2|nr:fimbrial protein [Pseudomonas aeruginosa]RTU08940.1 type 1 fimbrial protein [Pseudomonas aeruginosa]SQC94964.1 type-1 fimbrial protein subunit A [Pseudomonas aeruginosa]HBN9706126.1 type 1 fimbrial protein [Pseudomonas aeruginosa]HBN9725010.1 type 1 fimbrial protein [Pseudomonas aeruginosa]HBN9768113.1 type 1 fimbrial protein [Pseudomonas aeruginosa]
MFARTKSGPTAIFFAASVCAVLLAALSLQAQAACSWINGNNRQAITINAPLTLDVPSEPQMPSPLTDWLGDGDASTILWECKASLWGKVGVSVFTETVVADNNLKYDGFTVYKTSVPGVGFIGKYTLYTSSTGYGPVETDLSKIDRAMEVDSPAYMGFDLRLRLIKTGPIQPGAVLPAFEVAKGTSWVSGYRDLITRLSLPQIRFNVPTCQIPGIVEVPLGEVFMHKFKGAGSEAGAQDFEIPLRNCPGGFERIRYRLDPLGSIIDADKGLLQIDQGSGAASGVAVRINGRGAAVKFGVDQNLSGYTGAAGNFTIPLSASYYQTGPITPGAANASLEFTIKYQ